MACEQIAWIREASSGARRARVGSNADSDGPRSARETCVHSRDAECDSSVGDLMPGRTDFERRGVRTLTRELPEGMAADQHRQVMKMQYYFRLAWKAAVLRTIRGGGGIYELAPLSERRAIAAAKTSNGDGAIADAAEQAVSELFCEVNVGPLEQTTVLQVL